MAKRRRKLLKPVPYVPGYTESTREDYERKLYGRAVQQERQRAIIEKAEAQRAEKGDTITVGGATLRRADYARMLRRQAERRNRRREPYPERTPPEQEARPGAEAATDLGDFVIDRQGNLVRGKPAEGRRRRPRWVRGDPFTRPRGPVATRAVQDVVSELRGPEGGYFRPASPQTQVVSSGPVIRARRIAEQERALYEARKAAGIEPMEMAEEAQIRAEERGEQRRIAAEERRRTREIEERKEEREYEEQQRQERLAELRSNIEEAVDLIETTDLPGNAAAWSLKNEAERLMAQRQDVMKFVTAGALKGAKARQVVRGIDDRLANIATRLERMREQEAARRETAEEHEQEQERQEKLAIERRKAETEALKIEMESAADAYEAVSKAEREIRDEIRDLQKERRAALEEHQLTNEGAKEKQEFVDVWQEDIERLTREAEEVRTERARAKAAYETALRRLTRHLRGEEPSPGGEAARPEEPITEGAETEQEAERETVESPRPEVVEDEGYLAEVGL